MNDFIIVLPIIVLSIGALLLIITYCVRKIDPYE
jgi:hypothetical protein